MTVSLELFAGEAGQTPPVATPNLIGVLTAVAGPGLAVGLITSADDPCAAALLVAQAIVVNAAIYLTLDVTADAPDLGELVAFATRKGTSAAWNIQCGGTVDVTFTATVAGSAALATSGNTVQLLLQLTPTTVAEVSGGDLVTTMFDFRSAYNTTFGLSLGVI